MTALQLALSELKRMTAGFLPKIAILALSIVPLLYGAVYLYANWDPQANISNLTAALVVEDDGAVGPDGKTQQLGKQVAESLHESHSFTWEDVSSMDEAERGVETGQYAFAVRIPENFSASLLSTGHIKPGDENKVAVQALLEVTTNDANNYTLNTFVDKLLTEVHGAVAKQVGTETADRFLTSLGLIHTQMTKAADGADQVHQGTTKVVDGSGELTKGSKKLHDGIVVLDNGLVQLQTGQKKLQDGAAQLKTGTSQLTDGTGKLADGMSQMEQNTRTLVTDTRKLADGAEQVADANGQLNDKVQGAVKTIKRVPDQSRADLVASLDQMVADGVLTREQADQVLKRADEAREKAKQDPRVQQAEQTIDQASKDVQKLADGSRAVADGNRKLANATPKLRQGIVDANSGASQLDAGARKLDKGAGDLKNGIDRAKSGVDKLKNGSTQLTDGSLTLHQGVAKLWGGAKDLDKGAGELATALGDGADQVPHVTDAKKKNVSTVMGDPVTIKKVSQAKAATYGAGLAPFFLSLALWVGVFMLVQAMRPITRRALASNARAWRIAIGGWIPFWIVAVAQATFLGGVVHWVLGLQPASLPLTYGFMLLATMAFSAIIQGIVALFDVPGKFIVLILLVLQLVSSGGTLPWQLTPKPLHIVHDLLPMSHVVEGLRRLIYGSDIASVAHNAWMLVGYTVLGLSLSIIAAHKHKTWTLKTLEPEIAI